jgi:hypothetical protein
MVATPVIPEGFSPDASAFMSYVGAFAHNIERVDAAHGRSEKRQALARFRSENRKSLINLKKQRRIVTRFLATIVRRDLTLDEVESITTLALEKRKIEQEEMKPKLDRLEQNFKTRVAVWDEDALLCFRESIDLTAMWLAAHSELTDTLFKLAAERRAAAGEILRARPVAGEVDYAELSREHMARYPKIRAALAK